MTQPNLLFYMKECKTCNFFITSAHKANMLKNFKMICIDEQKDKFKAQGLKKVPTIIIPSINKQFEGSDCIKWLDEMIKLSSANNNWQMKNEELYIPDVGIVSNQPTNYNPPNSHRHLTQPVHLPYPIHPPHNDTMNHQISKLSTKISQLSTQMTVPNQFEVPKTNIIKRTGLNPIKPPGSIINQSNKNGKIIGQNPNQFNQQNPQNLQNPNPQSNVPFVRPVNKLFGYLQNEMSGFSDGYAYISVDNPLPKSFLPPDKDMEIYTAPEGDKVDKKKQEQLMKLAEMERNNEKEQYKNSIDEINRRIAMGEQNLLPQWVGANKDL
jgi:hypothetical protein